MWKELVASVAASWVRAAVWRGTLPAAPGRVASWASCMGGTDIVSQFLLALLSIVNAGRMSAGMQRLRVVVPRQQAWP